MAKIIFPASKTKDFVFSKTVINTFFTNGTLKLGISTTKNDFERNLNIRFRVAAEIIAMPKPIKYRNIKVRAW